MKNIHTLLPASRSRFRNYFLLLSLTFVLVMTGVKGWGQTNIIPTHTGTISSFPSWTHTNCVQGTASSNDYIQMLQSTSLVKTPTMDFTSYSNTTLDFKARTFGGPTTAQATITVSISVNNGSSWTVLGTRIPTSTTLTSVAQFSLSAYTGSQVLIKLETLGAGNSKGVGIDDIDIKGTVSGSTPPTITAAVNATVDAAFDVTFVDDATWRAAITGITVGGINLTAGYTVSVGKITFLPSASVPANLLQTSGSKTIAVLATGYSNATVSQTINPGVATKLSITQQPTAPVANGGNLAQQPKVAIQDQYGNTVTSSNVTVDAAVGAGTWTLGGTTSIAGVSGLVTFTNLTATSDDAVNGASIIFNSTGLTGATSNTFNIPAPPIPAAPIALNATSVASNSFLANWNSSSTATSYRLDVYTGAIIELLSTGFEGSTSFPSGWVQNSSYVQNNSSYAHTGSYYAGMNDVGDYFYPPLLTSPNTISFWVRTSASSANFTIKVQSSSNETDWTDLVTYNANGSNTGDITTTYVQKTVSTSLTGSNYIRWYLSARSGGSVYIDDILITTGSLSFVSGYQDLNVGNVTNYPVSGLNSNSGYHYVVRAVNNSGTSTNSNEISVTTTSATPAISSFTPTSTCSSSSTSVTILGTDLMSATAVKFNGVNAASFTVNSATEITATTPSGAYSTGKISVTTPGGTATSADDFSVTEPVVPSVTINASPGSTVANGTSVTFTPTPENGGSTPSYEWFVDDASKGISDTYTYVPGNGNQVHAVMTTSETCVTASTAQSNTITMTVNVPASSTFSGTGSWEDAAKWSDGVPGETTNVTIDGKATITDIGECNNCTISSFNAVTVNPGTGLIVNGNLLIQSGGSLISAADDLDVIGTTTVQRDITANQWHLVSSPISDAVSGMFSGKYLQKHSESSNEYTDITSTTELLVPEKGYAVFSDAAFTANFTGTLNSGSQSFTTTNTNSNGWNLVGNPYPSFIDWNAGTGWTKTNVDGTIYFHVNNTKWATWNGTTSVNGGSRYIAPCQGFFVHASGAGSLDMDNAVRTVFTGTFFKNTEEVVPNLVRLEVSGNGYNDEAVLYLDSKSTNEYDGASDAFKLYGSVDEAAQIYTLGSIPLAINTIPEAVPVTVGLHAGASGTYTIAATEINDLTNVKLEDTKTGIITSLAEKSYTFNWEAGENENRFILRFAAVGMEEPQQSISSIYSYDKTAIIDLPANVRGNVYIYNLAGQPVAVKESATGQVRINLSPTGVYVVKVVTDKETLTKKVWIR